MSHSFILLGLLTLDVIIINQENYTKPSAVVDFGFSDHHAQVLFVILENSICKTLRFRKRSLKMKI
jgi:hypothetical protein